MVGMWNGRMKEAIDCVSEVASQEDNGVRKQSSRHCGKE